jgi:polysaccharide biosynthesis transport protein
MFDETDKKPRSVEQVYAIVRRGRWWILVPLFICWITVWGISWILPTVYESEALILVEQQKVPEQYVVSNVTVDLQERLQSMTQQILSRTRLQSTIDRFHLYSRPVGLSRFTQSADPVDEMRKDIKIELVQAPGRPGDLTAFKIYYSAGSSNLAQQVNSELTSLFINESLKSQEQLSESTTSFLANQLTEARLKLEEQEAKVRSFKAEHLGDLPSQLQSNVEILSSLQVQLQNNQRALDGANQQRLYLESQLQQSQLGQPQSGDNSGPMSVESLENDLLELRNRLVAERARYKDEHPDIIATKRKIAETEKQLADLGAPNNGSTATTAESVPPRTLNSSQKEVWSQLKANDLEIRNYKRQEASITRQIASYQGRLNMTPETEQELADISRGYEESKSNYNSLLQKQNQSQLATNLEQRQQGEQFRILDPPSLPEKPKSPNHLLLSLAGLVLGCLAGLSLFAVHELINVRIRQEDDLDGILESRVLVRIPHLNTPSEGRRRARSRPLEIALVSVMVILVLVGNFYAFYKG